MSDDNGRLELARRLNRIFITPADGPGAGEPVDPATLLRFADDILAAAYSDPQWGERPGDGGPAARLVLETDA